MVDYNEIARRQGIEESRRLWEQNNPDKLTKRINSECDSLVCPCCEQHNFNCQNFYEVCPVCKWEDDPSQRENPDYSEGANSLSLNDYRKQWQERNAKKAV